MSLLSNLAIPATTFALWFISFLLTSYAVYYFTTALFAFKRYQPIESSAPKNKFAIIIAARNEAQVIGNLIRSLKIQDYPVELFEIFVIPNNCTDNTREAALNAGASILDCSVKVRSKGEVLSFAFSNLMKHRKDFDAFCIFDADNLVESNFLKEMNNLLCSGAQVAQGYRESKNPTDTIISSCYSIYYCSLNRFYNHARNAIGLSAVVNGTGFMVSSDVIRQLGGWNTQTITEDLEFTALCALNGIRIHWAPKAILYDEQPLTFMQSWNQRKRWSTGMQQCLSNYAKPLLSCSISRKSAASLDILLMFLATHMQVMGFISFILTITLTILKINYDLFPETNLNFKLFISLDTSYLMSILVSVMALSLENKSLIKFMKGIIFTWFFLMSWIPINCICLFSKQNDWKPIHHVRNLSIHDIIPLKLTD